MRLTLVLTHRCDLECGYCYAGPKHNRCLPVEVGQAAIDDALTAVGAGQTLSLGLFGGEPLLAWPLGRELIDYARERGREQGSQVAVHMTTNGTHLSPEVLDELVARDVELSLSVDGLPEVHDAWRPTRGGRSSSGAALRAMDRLLQRGLRFRIVTVVRPETVEHLVAGIRFLANRGARAFVPSLDWSARWEPQHGKTLQHAITGLRELWVERFPHLEIGWLETKAVLLARPDLGAPQCCTNHTAVAPSGRRYPCERLVGDDRGVLPILARSGAESPCQDCSIQSLCSSGSACVNHVRSGYVDQPDGLVCLLERACLREASRGLSELVRKGSDSGVPSG